MPFSATTGPRNAIHFVNIDLAQIVFLLRAILLSLPKLVIIDVFTINSFCSDSHAIHLADTIFSTLYLKVHVVHAHLQCGSIRNAR